MKGAIAWFIRNPVAANLLVIIILVSGAVAIPTIKKEIFPEFSADQIAITVAYPGAAPEEVEEGVCSRIEEAVYGLDGIKRIISSAAENAGVVTVELLPGHDARRLLDDVKSRVDAIDTFPEEAEKPVVSEVIVRSQVINVGISGKADEASLKHVGEQVRDEISRIPGITQVDLVSTKPYEISIEVPEASLRQYGLTFDEVAQAVRRSSMDLPGGSLKTGGGEILVRVKGQAYRGRDFEKIPLRTNPDGSRLLLGSVATVQDTFAEEDKIARLDAEPAVMVQVFRVGDQNALEIAKKVKDYIAEAQQRMP